MKFFRFIVGILASVAVVTAAYDWRIGATVEAFWMLGLAIVNLQTLILTRPTVVLFR